MVGRDGNDEPPEEFLDPLVSEDPVDEEWEWEEEAKHQKIRKRRTPFWDEGGSRKKGRGGSFRKKR